MDMTDNSDPFLPRGEPPADESQPFLRLPLAVGLLAGLLVAAHAARSFLPAAMSSEIIANYALIPARYSHVFLAAHHLDGGSLLDRALPFVTYIFLHASWTHVGLNTLWLLAFGPLVARRFGAVRFFAFFLVCGVAGAATHLAFNWGSADPVIGASAGVSGLMAASFRLIGSGPMSAQTREPLAPLLSRQILTWTALWAALNVLAGLTGLGSGPGVQTIAWQAHLGGYFAGLFLCGLFDPVTRLNRSVR
jgi:membrane associated rhomboid family serine protease